MGRWGKSSVTEIEKPTTNNFQFETYFGNEQPVELSNPMFDIVAVYWYQHK